MVGVGDSGLDVDSCYFFDPSVSFSAGITTAPDGTRVFESATHRKVAYYLGRKDTVMLDGIGHGTHVCGTIAGVPYGAPSDASDPGAGMAPGARVGFIDLSSVAQNDVAAPDDLAADYYPMAYARGARIHSGARPQHATGRRVGADSSPCVPARPPSCHHLPPTPPAPHPW